MNVIKRFVGLVVLMVVVQSSVAAPFGVEARSLGMGNVSVVTSDIATAAFANPAMLSFQSQREDFSFLIPAVGLFLDDSDGVVDLIDAYQAAAPADQPAIVAQLLGKVISPQLAVATAIGYSGDTYSFAVSARSDINAAGTTDVITDPLDPALVILGIQTTEVGVSLARNFVLMGRKVSVGLTPKIINVKSLFIEESLFTIDSGDILDDSSETDHGDLSTVDAGVVFEVSENIQLGLVAKNLLTDEVNIGPGTTLNIDTELRAGIAYRGDFFTLGADLDLSENDPSVSTIDPALAALQGEKTRMLLLGAEFNAFDIAQLRVGMQKNIASGVSSQAKKELLTAGVGFWFGFHLDLAVISGDDVLGAFIQTGFRF